MQSPQNRKLILEGNQKSFTTYALALYSHTTNLKPAFLFGAEIHVHVRNWDKNGTDGMTDERIDERTDKMFPYTTLSFSLGMIWHVNTSCYCT